MKHAGKRHFSATINREKLREFVQRRRINAFGLLALTVLSVVITLLGVLTGFPRTNILAFVTIMLLLLCAVGSTPLCAGALKHLKVAHPRLHTVLTAALLVAGFALCLTYVVDAGYNPFLYFRF